MMENFSMHELEKLTRNPWHKVYAQGGILKESGNPSFHGCCVANLLVLNEQPLWIYVEDSGEYKEVDLGLRVYVDEKFGQKGHESLFRPSRMEVIDFPESCRLDCFLNKKSLMISRTICCEGGQLLKGVVLGNSKGDHLGIFVDEVIPLNLLLTTDVETIAELCRQSTS